MIMLEDIRIDRLAKRIYGTELGGTVEAILNANVGLAALITPTGIVPAGTDLVLPEVVAEAAPTITRPWD